MNYILSLLISVTLMVSCGSDKKSNEKAVSDANAVTVQELMQVKGYTYIRGLQNNKEVWLAGPTATLEVGSTYYYGETMEMKNFESKELNRSFETIYFVERFADNPEMLNEPLTKKLHGQSNIQVGETPEPVIEKNEVKVEPASDGISIAELFENKAKYEGQIVKLKGKVTKYNPAIMGVNWFHIQDGTDFNGEFDLTVTTSAEVKLDEVVTFQGKVTLDKDFGAGYFYAIIIENAELIK